MEAIFTSLGYVLGGPENALILVLAFLKIGMILGGVIGVIPFIILFERKIISWVQDRPGPNRVGPWGIFQGIIDGVKLLFKESIVPSGVDRGLYLIAPALVIIPAFLALCLVPVGPIIGGNDLDTIAKFFGLQNLVGSGTNIREIPMAIINPNIGILYLLAITSVGVYGITLAGWSSNNKWSLLGGIRASAQMISYEITLSLAILGVILLSGSLNLYDILARQSGGLLNWNVIAQPVGFLLFVIAMFAETNRLPFDLAESESELTGGFHTEYSAMRFACFFLGEYVNMVIVSAICATLFLGGFQGPIPIDWEAWAVWASGLIPGIPDMVYGLVIIASYMVGPMLILPAKVAFFLFLFIFARATLPRLRYDQLMSLGWKQLLPIGLINLVLTAIAVGIVAGYTGSAELSWGAKAALGAVTLALFLAYDFLILTPNRNRRLQSEYRGLRPRNASRPEALGS